MDELIVFDTDNYNSWVSYEDACTYFETHLKADEWEAIREPMRTWALITAFNMMRELSLDLVDLRNEIEFEKDDGKTSTLRAELLDALKRGQCEQALHILTHGISTGSDVKSFQLGGLISATIKSDNTPPDYSERALNILHPYIIRKTIKKYR